MSSKRSVVLRLLFAVLCCSFTQVHTQTLPLRVSAVIPDADIINAGSIFDPMADRIKDLPPQTFSLTFINQSEPRQDLMAVMHIEAYVTLDEDHQRMRLYTANSKAPFSIPAQGRVFTSADTRDLGDMQFITVEEHDNVQKVKDKVWDPASGGRVPSGTYEVSVTLTVVQIGSRTVSQMIPVFINPVVVSNPTVATLLMPAENGERYPTMFPQFQWMADTRSITLTVNEVRAGQSLLDASQSSDHYLQVHIDRQESHHATQFTYPQSGAALPGIEITAGPRPLQAGHTYVLVMEGNRTSVGISVDPLRTIRSFTIDNPRAQAQAAMLRTILSTPELQQVSAMVDGNNLQLDAEGIMLNGVPSTLQQLQAFIMRHQHRAFTVHIEE